MEEGPERDALTAALAKECYVPVYLDPKTVCSLPIWRPSCLHAHSMPEGVAKSAAQQQQAKASQPKRCKWVQLCTVGPGPCMLSCPEKRASCRSTFIPNGCK